MTFTSFNFLVFFPLVIILYNLIPQKVRLWYLLVVSYLFYINLQPVYALLLVLVTLTTFFFTKAIASSQSEKTKHRLLIGGILLILLPLFFFKYFSFINNSIISLLEQYSIHIALPSISWMLPIGISFYTFMAIGYIIDVYNEEVEFEKNPASTGLFLSFFPIILSGPIERAGNMLPQFKELKQSTYEDLTQGAKWMLWGYFMKLCVADRLGLYVDAVFNNIPHHNGTTLAFASILYPFQVYGDLGGYSLIAIGAARCMGIKIIPNFNRPFFATSMAEFWRRWHMSLIQWLTDYIYTPLSFVLRKWKIWGIVAALMLTFFISGIWHGAAMTFVVWGLVQGVYLSIEALINPYRTAFENRFHLKKNPLYILICCVIIFVLFAFSQIFANCTTLQDFLTVFIKLVTQKGHLFMDASSLFMGGLSLFIMFIKDLKDEFNWHIHFMNSDSKVVRYMSVVGLIVYVMLFGVLDGGQFIYFQF